MQLGLFFTGCSPAGGASNMWTVILGGNLDLSVTMSTTSTLAAFGKNSLTFYSFERFPLNYSLIISKFTGMMPLWIFTVGRMIFERGNLEVPYQHIATYVYSLIIPVIIGLVIQRKMPRLGKFLVRILKSLSAIFIIFIVVFAIVTNLYLFKLFTWQVS